MKFVFSSLVAAMFLISCGNTFYIVRHAEKAAVEPGADKMMASNPPLSEAGQLRSLQLRDQLRAKNIQYIFSTNTTRTISTAQPLNELRGSTRIETYNTRDSLNQFIEKVKGIKKGNVLIVGHSNTVDDIANKLCGSTVVPGDLKETQYDNLFIVKRKGSRFVFSRKKYGTPTE